ncbi:hypothetical protein CEXT_184551 [Caerostris extrusa]|uniref:Uncharacterized protein n=1 Tax=Caerostris extrusa TaxID=172846 RepID=A0AAV4SUC3_CAEEX|nr:hypothetical protein CEXT_184551 [Caerostris extrusa]
MINQNTKRHKLWQQGHLPSWRDASSFPNSLTNLLLETVVPPKRTFNSKTTDEHISSADALKNQQQKAPTNPVSTTEINIPLLKILIF